MKSFIDKGVSSMMLKVIDIYQKSISAHKGYSCAYRDFFGGNVGCSGFAKITIQNTSLIHAIPLIFKRVNACGFVAKTPTSQLNCRHETEVQEVIKQINIYSIGSL